MGRCGIFSQVWPHTRLASGAVCTVSDSALLVPLGAAPAKPAEVTPASSRVLGIAVCWEADRCYYLPAPPAGTPSEALWAPVRAALQDDSARKVTYDLKPQLAGLARAGGSAGRVLLADPLVDVRIAAWLLNPDAKEVRNECN